MKYAPVAQSQPITMYASTPDRIWGGVVDGVIVTILGYAAGIAAVTVHALLVPAAYAGPNGDGSGSVVAVLAFLAAYFAYNMAFELTSGRTLGKRLAGTKVVSEDGFPITAWQSFLRNGFRFGGSLLLLNIPALIAIWRSRRKQRIGDMVAKTVVIKVGG